MAGTHLVAFCFVIELERITSCRKVQSCVRPSLSSTATITQQNIKNDEFQHQSHYNTHSQNENSCLTFEDGSYVLTL